MKETKFSTNSKRQTLVIFLYLQANTVTIPKLLSAVALRKQLRKILAVVQFFLNLNNYFWQLLNFFQLKQLPKVFSIAQVKKRMHFRFSNLPMLQKFE